jgi:hypothetical protein
VSIYLSHIYFSAASSASPSSSATAAAAADACLRLKLARVFFMSIATVMGPTPPGTGVIWEAYYSDTCVYIYMYGYVCVHGLSFIPYVHYMCFFFSGCVNIGQGTYTQW